VSQADPDQIGRGTHSLQLAVGTGEPLTSEQAANSLPQAQRHRGHVFLIVDALTYSAADIFAAGFQDNQLGLGTSATTGAGDANVWTANRSPNAPATSTTRHCSRPPVAPRLSPSAAPPASASAPASP
jgi:hypothetical protein